MCLLSPFLIFCILAALVTAVALAKQPPWFCLLQGIRSESCSACWLMEKTNHNIVQTIARVISGLVCRCLMSKACSFLFFPPPWSLIPACRNSQWLPFNDTLTVLINFIRNYSGGLQGKHLHSAQSVRRFLSHPDEWTQVGRASGHEWTWGTIETYFQMSNYSDFLSLPRHDV